MCAFYYSLWLFRVIGLRNVFGKTYTANYPWRSFTMKSFLSRFPLSWACYLAYFVGVSFQSGGIVHYSLDPSRYGKLIAIGAVIFVIGAISSDLISKESRLRETGPVGFITFIASSLVLSIGVGLIGGSVQHFNDIPGRAPIYVGLGVVLSALGYHGRFQPHHTKKEFVGAMVIVSSLAIPAVVALRSYAATLPVTAAEHGHGSESSTTDSGAEARHVDAPHDEGTPANASTLVKSLETSTTTSVANPVATNPVLTEPVLTEPIPTTLPTHDPKTHDH
jgi:hypothetical protein